MLKHKKIQPLNTLKDKLQALKKQGKKIVFTNGCYDILHPGHVDLLSRAKELGDILVLGLNSDSSVARQGKGQGRPFNSYDARAFVLCHLESIDFVIDFEEDTPLRLIEELTPHILVKGGDWDISKIVGKDFVEKNGGTVHALPLIEGFSTTKLATKIAQLAKVGLL